MKKNNLFKSLPVLVLSFANVQGQARHVLQKAVQEALFILGFHWEYTGAVVSNDDAPYLFVNYHTLLTNGKHILYGSTPDVHGCEVVQKFEVTQQMSDFLFAAKRLIPEHRTIEGVEVTILHDKITMDTTALLERVAATAKQVQDEHFGRV
jgi:hypothetical protein